MVLINTYFLFDFFCLLFKYEIIFVVAVLRSGAVFCLVCVGIGAVAVSGFGFDFLCSRRLLRSVEAGVVLLFLHVQHLKQR